MPCAHDLVAVELGHAEGEALEQVGGGVPFPVPLLVVGDGEPEVGAEVDHVADRVDQVTGERLGLAVREAQERQVEAREVVRGHLLVGHALVRGGQRRVEVADGGARVGVGGDEGDLDVGMAGEEPEELRSGVPRSPDDGRSIRHRRSIHTPAYLCERTAPRTYAGRPAEYRTIKRASSSGVTPRSRSFRMGSHTRPGVTTVSTPGSARTRASTSSETGPEA